MNSGNDTVEKPYDNISKNQTDPFHWTIMFDNPGEYDHSLKLYNESDTSKKKINWQIRH